ncbi:MAG: T9SS type A sorting domain-containing protein [Flavobacteriales bacterium]|nr:T9SS type A sorting domain-containing protein [Flavobacteriales bacterium]
MKRTLRALLGIALVAVAANAPAQRYLTEVFTNAQITVTPDIPYGVNIDFLTSTLTDQQQVLANAIELQGLVTQGQPIPPAYFDPTNPSTALKVTTVRFDLYQPDQSIDTETKRPLVVYLHTGNALPPPFNGSPNGRRTDSTAVEVCKRMARRGYVAASVSYRLGWNPLAPTEEERRAQLLNAIYRALHDTRHFIRTMKESAEAGGENQYNICGDRIIVLGEGTGGYIALAHATLDKPAELFIEKFRPNPFDPTVSYVDTNLVGNLSGFGGLLNLYRPNGYDHKSHFTANMGGALADTSWLEPGDGPMVCFHTVFDPFAPFTEGIVIVPTTGGPVVDVQGPNLFLQLANQYNSNMSFSEFPSADPYTIAARSRYGNTYDGVTVNTGVEGLNAFLRPRWPAPAGDEASPWQFWDPNHPLALAEVAPGITAHMASMASNPDMSPQKARAYIDTVMGYLNPRIYAALSFDAPCLWVGQEEETAQAHEVSVFPNPANDRVFMVSKHAGIRAYEVFDVNGRLQRTATVNSDRVVMERQGLQPGVYIIKLHFADGELVRRVVLE